jgi:hypothetical protein
MGVSIVAVPRPSCSFHREGAASGLSLTEGLAGSILVLELEATKEGERRTVKWLCRAYPARVV